MSARRGGIPGPESRTGLVRPAMTEAEFERRQTRAEATSGAAENEPGTEPVMLSVLAEPPLEPSPSRSSVTTTRARNPRSKPARPRRVQRMFAVEEDLDKKLWLYAIHVGKDRSDVINDLLRPLVQSMVLYDSRDRRRGATDAEAEGQGGVAE